MQIFTHLISLYVSASDTMNYCIQVAKEVVWKGILCLFIHLNLADIFDNACAQLDKLTCFTITAALYLHVSHRFR